LSACFFTFTIVKNVVNEFTSIYKLALDLITAMAYIRNKYFLSAICYSLLAFLFALGCGRPSGIGIGGRYLDAKFDVWRPRGDVNGAITKLEYIVKQDPLYKNSLTLLGRAYYKSRRYRDAFQILKRAVAVNRKYLFQICAMAVIRSELACIWM